MQGLWCLICFWFPVPFSSFHYIVSDTELLHGLAVCSAYRRPKWAEANNRMYAVCLENCHHKCYHFLDSFAGYLFMLAKAWDDHEKE